MLRIKGNGHSALFFGFNVRKKQVIENLEEESLFFNDGMDSRLHVRELDNGFSYWIRPHFKSKNRARLQLIFRVGSILETEEQQGLAHILEHMAFHGSDNCSKEELEQYFESIGMSFGAHVNAQTGFEKTIYKIEVPTDNLEQFRKSFHILRDWCSNLLLETEEIEKERKIGLEEYRHALSGMWRVKKQLLPKMYFGGKQVERLPIGTKEALESFDPEALRQFYRRWYQPQFAGLLVVGDVDVEETSRLIEELFSDWKNESKEELNVPSLDIEHEDLWVTVTDQEVPYPICGILHKRRALVANDEDAYFQKLLYTILEDILNHRFAFLTRDPDCELHHVYCGSQDLSLDTEGLFIQGTCQQDSVKEGIYRLVQELKTTHHFGVLEEEVERSKSRLVEMFHMLALEEDKLPLDYVSSELLSSFLQKEAVYTLQERYLFKKSCMEKISKETIDTFMRELWSGKGFVFQYVAPVEQQLSEDEFRTLIEEAMTQPLLAQKEAEQLKPLLSEIPEAKKTIAEEYYEKYDLTEWRYANGAKVWLKPTSFQARQIRFRAIGQGGYCWAPDQKLYSAKTALDISHYSGAGEHSADELDLIMSSPKSSLNFNISNYNHTISGYAFPDSMEGIWQYFWLRTQKPAWKESVLGKVLEWKRTQIQNQDNDPNNIFSRQVRYNLWGHHPRKKVITVDELDSIKLDEAKEFFEKVFNPVADMTYIFVGAFDLEDIKPVIDRYIGGLPQALPREKTDSGERIFRGEHSEVLHLEQEEKARIHIGFARRGVSTPMMRFASNYLRMIFEERLRKELREELGGTYHVQVGAGFIHYPEELFHLECSFVSEPDRMDELKFRMKALLQEFQKEGSTQEEMDITTTKILRQLDEDEKEDSYWLSLFSTVAKRQKDLADIFDLRQAIKELDLVELNKISTDLLQWEDTMEVILLPQETE